MVAPILARVNTIGIRFTKGSKTEELLDKIIHDKLGILVNELAGLADYGPKKHCVKVHSEQMYNHLVARYVGFSLRIDRVTEIEVDDLSSYRDRVKISRVPFEMTSDTLKSLLGRYGQVDRLIRCMSRTRRHRNVPTDEAIAFMSVDNPIPSSLWIIEAQQNLFFHYNNQPQTCVNCGSLDHKAYRCNTFRQTRPDNRPNAISIAVTGAQTEEDNVTSASSLNDNNVGDNNDTNDVNNNDDNNDGDHGVSNDDDSDDIDDSDSDDVNTSSDGEYIDSGNEENDTNFEDQFACPECAYKCNTAHGLSDHMKTHTAYADRARSPPKTPSYSNDKKRAASTSPNPPNGKNSKAQKTTTFKPVSKSFVFYKM